MFLYVCIVYNHRTRNVWVEMLRGKRFPEHLHWLLIFMNKVLSEIVDSFLRESLCIVAAMILVIFYVWFICNEMQLWNLFTIILNNCWCKMCWRRWGWRDIYEVRESRRELLYDRLRHQFEILWKTIERNFLQKNLLIPHIIQTIMCIVTKISTWTCKKMYP